MNETTLVGGGASPNGTSARDATDAANGMFCGFRAFDVGSAGDGRPLDLSLGKRARGVLVLAVTPGRCDEVLCAWSDGVSFAPPGGTYYAFWMAVDRKPTADQIARYLASHGEAGTPGTIGLRPPPSV